MFAISTSSPMPSPAQLASKEEEERRAWVTQHHEVVRLVKDCFGDRFSNNEIFDRLKISRRTGYRALGNDDRIGKAPGRKPKIAENTIKEMIDYIENGGCNDVGNVWKHLAEKFAPDCNSKTVQDAVKKSGFKNYRSTVKLEPLLNEQIQDGHGSDNEDQMQQIQHAQQLAQEQHRQQQEDAQIQAQQQAEQQARQQAEQQAQQAAAQQQQQQQLQSSQQQLIDPSFQPPTIPENLRVAIEHGPDGHIRYALYEVCNRIPESVQVASAFLFPFLSQTPSLPILPNMLATSAQIAPQPQMALSKVDPVTGKRLRLAVCRRCNQQYDRAENNMDNRNCLYHKGSPQKIFPDENATILQTPESFIWSCCGGNGLVRGCCRAMHTTKKKRKYGKKRTVSDAGLDGTDAASPDDNGDMSGADDGDTTYMSVAAGDAAAHMALGSSHGLGGGNGSDDMNIDSRLQDFAAAQHAHQRAQAAAAHAAVQAAAAAQAGEQSEMAAVQHQLQMQMAGLGEGMQGFGMVGEGQVMMGHGLHDGMGVHEVGDVLGAEMGFVGLVQGN